ncbi:MAG TPA: IPT/TIG domain-containing protein [Steroidobacteraceae bacterium]|nr:IPT/TIG domain-containing protein [Steroidobacteraceae bacterium]
MTLSTNTLSFHADSVNSTTPGGQTVSATVTGVTAPVLYLIVKVNGPAVATVSNFTITGTTGGQAQVYPQGQSALGAGSFSSTVTVIACTTDPGCSSTQLSGSPAVINVTYTIDGVNSSAASVSYAIGNAAPTANDLAKTFNVTGYPVQNFTVASDSSWLTVTPPGASTSATTAITAALDQAQLDKLDSGTYTGNVTLTPSSGIAVVVPVTLNVKRTQVNYATPYAQSSGMQSVVIIRGENFSLVHPTAVQFGSTAATSFTVVSDTEIHAIHPPLGAGTYPVHVINLEGVDRTRAQLTVVDVPSYAADTWEFSDPGDERFVDALVYDAGRDAVLVAAQFENPLKNAIYRFAYSAGSWNLTAAQVFPGLRTMALSADGAKLFAVADALTVGLNSDLIEVDPVTLTTNLTTFVANFGPPTQIAVVNDGLAILTGGLNALEPILSYRELRPQLVPLNPLPNGPTSVYNGAVAASGDGSAAEISDGLDGQVFAWNASTGQLSIGPQSHNFAEIKLNQDGTRAVRYSASNGAQVYDSSENVLGSLPATTVAAVLAPSGLRAYTYDNNDTVRVFDLSAPPSDPQSQYPEILPAIVPASVPTLISPLSMVMSPDGGTVFLAGDMGVVVVPLP